MMTCGHAANATRGGQPSCAICAGVSVVDANPPSLEGRFAKCGLGCNTPPQPSDPDKLAFFEYTGDGSKESRRKCGTCGYFDVAHGKPHIRCATGFVPKGAAPFDRYYCGCRGWD